MCFKVQLNKSDGGLNARALYLDTENSFRPERIFQIAKNYYHQKMPNIEENLLGLKAKQILDGIHLRNVNTNADDLYNIIINGQIDSFLESHPNIRLIILDSIAYHFRYDYEYDIRTRTKQLIYISNKLKQLANEKNLAVMHFFKYLFKNYFIFSLQILITNQVKLSNEPALGNLWNSISSNSFYLSRLNPNKNDSIHSSIRHCSVIKSLNCLPGFNFNYKINVSLWKMYPKNLFENFFQEFGIIDQ